MKAIDQPDIILVGSGLPGGLQLTVAGQRILDRTGKAYALSLPAPLARHLKALGVKATDLGEALDAAASPGEGYAAVARTVLEATTREKPVVVLMPGSPLFLNTISRVIVAEGRRHDLTVHVLPAVSPLEGTISYLGLDVASFGLQVFTGNRLARADVVVNPTVPLIVLELAATGLNGTGSEEPSRFRPLIRCLARFYPPEHPATLVQASGRAGQRAHATAPLNRFPEFLPHITNSSQLFIDRRIVRKET